MHDGGRKAILAAFSANAGIAVAKFVGFLVTGASSMLAESVHSLADSGNQGLLLMGASRASREENAVRPFGYGRERYFWAFVVALVIFVLGGAFAIYEGVHKLQHPEPLQSPLVAVAILVVSVLLEGYSFITAIREASQDRAGMSWATYYKRTKSAELPVILLEDLGALVGLMLALVGVGVAAYTGDPRWDALGSIVIGFLLTAIAVTLSIKMKSLLVGESASDADAEQLLKIMSEGRHVRKVLHMRTNHLGPDKLLVAIKAEFDPDLTFVQISDAINEVEKALRAAVPEARYIYIEPDVPREVRRPGLDE